MITTREDFRARMEDFWQTYSGSAEFWEDLAADYIAGRHPTTAALHRGMASGRPLPAWAADYIAGRLDGTVKLPRGRPQWSDAGLAFREAGELAPGRFRPHRMRLRRWLNRERVMRMKAELEHPDYAREYKREHGRRPPTGNTYRKALSEVSKETGTPAETLDKHVYPRVKK